jgi:hypothetical protein
MAKKNRKNIEYPDKFMKDMKKKKRKKIRSTPIDKEITEQQHNDAERIL